MYEKVLLWATPLFLLMMAVECAVAAVRNRSRYRLADALTSVSLGALSTYVGVFTRLFSFGIYVMTFNGARIATLDADAPVVWFGGLLLYDFLYYWNHRLGHEVNILWAAHVVHHQSEEFNLSTALRQTSSGFLLSWIFFLPMALLGFPPALFLVFSLVDLLYQFWIHTEQIGSLGAFDRIFASPSNHRVHHAVNDIYVDRNYGGILILWDRLFGSFQDELPEVPVTYGTRDPVRSWNPLWVNLQVYAALARDVVHTRSWADRLRLFWKPPGWRPDDLAARLPKQPFDVASFERYAPCLPTPLGLYCFAQGILTIAFGAYYLAVLPQATLPLAFSGLALLVASLWIIGGLAEARRGFVWLEGGRLLLTAALCVAAAPVFGPAVATGLVVGGLMVFGTWLWLAGRSVSAAATA